MEIMHWPLEDYLVHPDSAKDHLDDESEKKAPDFGFSSKIDLPTSHWYKNTLNRVVILHLKFNMIRI
jgi:hypothetical protein